MRSLLIPVAMAGALALGGCASNYAGEGALAGGVAGALIGGTEGAAIGAGVGAVGGSAIDKDDRRRGCYRRDRDGDRYWDRNC